jgi:HK97 family phage major capsid protein
MHAAEDDMADEVLEEIIANANAAHGPVGPRAVADIERRFGMWLDHKSTEVRDLLDGRGEGELKADEARRHTAISTAIARGALAVSTMHRAHAALAENRRRVFGDGADSTGAPSTASRLPSMREYEARGLRIGVDTDGGYLVNDQIGPLVDRLRPSSIILQAKPRIFQMTSDAMELPKLSQSSTVYATGEIGEVTASQPVFGRVRLQSNAYSIRAVGSLDWFSDAQPDARNLLADDMSKQLALKYDVDCLEGDGTSTKPIVGLRHISGITQTEVAAGSGNGGLPSLADIINAIDRLERDNATPSFIAMHPRSWASYRKLEDQQDRLQLTPDPSQAAARQLFGLPVLLTSQISIAETQGSNSDCSYIVVGDGSQLAVGIRTQNFVIYDPYTYSSTRQVQVVQHSRVAFNVLNVEGVEIIEGVRTS